MTSTNTPSLSTTSMKPLHKRRKICRPSSATTLPSIESTPLLSVSNLTAKSTVSGENIVCISCQRALARTQGNLVYCARCSSPTCTICSRTCSASTYSQPPTPLLTWSRTPSPSPTPSPRRSALTLHFANKSSNKGKSIVGKRKKLLDEDDPAADGEEKVDEHESEEEHGPGCGRLICRNCCFENLPRNSITCLDCNRI